MSHVVTGAVGGMVERGLRLALGAVVPPLRVVSAVTGAAAGIGEGILERLSAEATAGAGRDVFADAGRAPYEPSPVVPPRQWRPPTEPSAATAAPEELVEEPVEEPVGEHLRASEEFPAAARVAGAPGVSTAAADEVTQELAEDLGLAADPVDALAAVVPGSADELPVPDWDHLTTGRLQTRIRGLALDDLVILRAWEQKHAARLQVLTMLENRIARTSAEEEEATPS